MHKDIWKYTTVWCLGKIESSWRELRTRRGISQKDEYNWPITWWDNTLKYQQTFLNGYLLSPFALPSLHLHSLVFHTDGLKEMVV